MRSTGRGVTAVLISLAILLAFGAVPATALTVQRTWAARVGTSGVNGAVVMRAYTNLSGSVAYSLKGLRPSALYGVQIRTGTCASPGAVAARLTSIRTSASGAVSRADPIDSGTMYLTWTAARTPSFVIRFVSGTSIRCGPFSFVHATRVVVSGLGIDLPIVRGPSGYPYCNVAMYLARAAQPREPGITFIFAHARRGMFLPLLSAWRANRGASLIGRTVKVWTSDSRVVYYRINRVRVTSNAVAGVTSLTTERLWLQTSTGPTTAYPKLIVEAYRYAVYSATYAASHPAAHPIRC